MRPVRAADLLRRSRTVDCPGVASNFSPAQLAAGEQVAVLIAVAEPKGEPAQLGAYFVVATDCAAA